MAGAFGYYRRGFEDYTGNVRPTQAQAGGQCQSRRSFHGKDVLIRDFLYTPINTVKPVADEVWIVDGPEIRFGMGPFNMSFPTRMTLIRLPGGKLVVHSPTALTPDLAQEVEALGEVADIVAPNKIQVPRRSKWNCHGFGVLDFGRLRTKDWRH